MGSLASRALSVRFMFIFGNLLTELRDLMLLPHFFFTATIQIVSFTR